jgi:pilus assembly protein CpaF
MFLKPDFKRLILPHVYAEIAPPPEQVTPEQRDCLQAQVSIIVQQVLKNAAIELDAGEFDQVLESMMVEVTGLSVLEALLADDRITEITVIGPKQIFITFQGERCQVESQFDDLAHLMRTIYRLFAGLGEWVDINRSHNSLFRTDGSQVEVILPPLARQPMLHIVKNSRAVWTDSVMVCRDMITSAAMEFLKYAVLARLNIAVIGASGSRKTELLNALITPIPTQARIVLIEDRVKLQPPQQQVIELTLPDRETAPHLMRQISVLRPDYCIVAGTSGELLSRLICQNVPYVIDFPAQDAASALREMTAVCRSQMDDVPQATVLSQLAKSLNLVVGLEWRQGARKVTFIGEVNPDASLTPIWDWRDNGLRVTGMRPRCLWRLENAGLTLPVTAPVGLSNRLLQQSS